MTTRPIGAGAATFAIGMAMVGAFMVGRATAADASNATCDPVVTNPDGSSHQACTYPTPGGATNCTTQPHTGTDPTTGDVQIAITLCDPTADALRAQLRRERAIHAGELRRLRTELRAARRTWRPTVDHAIALAAAAYGVSRTDMRRVAHCESTMNPHARNGRYIGLFQTGPAFWQHTPFAAFDRIDPYANALAAAQVVAAQGWRQWSCRP